MGLMRLCVRGRVALLPGRGGPPNGRGSSRRAPGADAPCPGADLTVVERELTLVGVNPAMDGLEESAATARTLAQEQAKAAGLALAARLAAGGFAAA